MTRLPAEWEPQDGVMLTWPQSNHHWGNMTSAVEAVFLNIAHAVCERERLIVICRDDEHHAALLKRFKLRRVNCVNVAFVIATADDVWARDHGPLISTSEGSCIVNDFQFNGWGGKYPADADNKITSTMFDGALFNADQLNSHQLVLEGGGVETNGAGKLLLTRSCILTDSRNPRMSASDVEEILSVAFGTPDISWLAHGHLEGDDTDGHIDTLARYINPSDIVSVSCPDHSDPHYAALFAMNQELDAICNNHGQRISLPWPGAIFNESGVRLPATYANFLFINGAILMPTYQRDTDDAACQLMRDICPSHEIIPIDALPLIHQFGSIHCVTMQLPQGSLQS